MTFKESFERFQSGTATENERRMVEEELEKAAIINEHLFGTFEIESPVVPMGEFKQVRRSLRKRNISVVLTSLVLTAAMLLGAVTLGIPLAESRYFDPTQATYSDNRADLDLALYCYYSLFAPQQDYRHFSDVTDTGFASWDVEFCLWDEDVMGQSSYHTASVTKNQLKFPRNTFFYAPHTYFQTANRTPMEENWIDYVEEDVSRQLHHVEDDDTVYAAVTFCGDLDMETLWRLAKTYGVFVQWAAIRTDAPGRESNPMIGLNLKYSLNDPSVNAHYPSLATEVIPENAEEHIRSKIQYLMDYEENNINIGIVPDGYYEKAVAYLDDHGLQFYGGFISGSRAMFMEMVEDGLVIDFYILGVQDYTVYSSAVAYPFNN